jgi:hypothetical protein
MMDRVIELEGMDKVVDMEEEEELLKRTEVEDMDTEDTNMEEEGKDT